MMGLHFVAGKQYEKAKNTFEDFIKECKRIFIQKLEITNLDTDKFSLVFTHILNNNNQPHTWL